MPEPRPEKSLNRPKIETIVIIAHGPLCARRLAWRFDGNIFSVKTCDLTKVKFDAAEPTFNWLLIFDLGWEPAELEISMALLFEVTRKADPPRVVVLAPRLFDRSRPGWAELGVVLALDRTTPPPEIAEYVGRLCGISTD